MKVALTEKDGAVIIHLPNSNGVSLIMTPHHSSETKKQPLSPATKNSNGLRKKGLLR
jgi:hypothetical protein